MPKLNRKQRILLATIGALIIILNLLYLYDRGPDHTGIGWALSISTGGLLLLPILSGEKDNAEEKIENHEEKSLDGIGAILSMQLFPQHHNIKSAFGEFMVSKKAQGYLFGFHDAWARTVNKLSSAKAVEFMGESYSRLFGISSAQCLITNVLGLQDDEDFISGRDEGAEDCLSFLRNGRQPLGLSRIFMFSKKDDHKRDAVGPWG